jgi:hypothetical protein
MAKVKINLEEFKEKMFENLDNLRDVISESETAQKIIDGFFDVVENYIKESKTKVDDAIGLPACALIRGVIGVPDND